jgi:integrase
MAKKKLPRGIRQRADGSYQVHKMIAGVRAWESFPAGTPESKMIAWRESYVGTPTPARLEVPSAGSFAADIADYARRCAAKPTITGLVGILERWAGALGRDRSRASITRAEIEIVAQAWIVAGLKPVTVRKYCFTLQGFYGVLNGDDGDNPVRRVVKPNRPKYGEPRALEYETIEHILGTIAITCHKPKIGLAPNKSAYRLRVLACTGLPPGVLGQLRPIDVKLAAAIVELPERLKGDEVEARAIPLTDQGVAAFRDFAQVNAWGSFNVPGLNRVYQRAAVRAGVVDPTTGQSATTQYDLRHSFGTMLYRETRDIATVGRFLGHAEGSPFTLRYALGAHRDVDRAAAAAVSARLAAASAAERKRRANVRAWA